MGADATGAPIPYRPGMAETTPAVPDAVEDGTTTDDQPPVSEPTKLIRIASMTRAVLEELRTTPLDAQAAQRVLDIHRASLHELREVLSDDLQDEFDEIFAPFEGTPSEATLRIAHAQLIGWLEGLFHGIQATIATQQMLASNQLAQMRQRQQLEASSGSDDPEYPGVYL
jgi:hypothetical protein